MRWAVAGAIAAAGAAAAVMWYAWYGPGAGLPLLRLEVAIICVVGLVPGATLGLLLSRLRRG